MGVFRQKLKTKHKKSCALSRQKSATDSASCTKSVKCLPVSVPKGFFLPFKDLNSSTYLETKFLFLNTRNKKCLPKSQNRKLPPEKLLVAYLQSDLWFTCTGTHVFSFANQMTLLKLSP